MFAEPAARTQRVLLIAGAVAILTLALAERRKVPGIGSLETLDTSQDDGNLDYGSLDELADSETTRLIDAINPRTKNGYLFESAHSPTTSEFVWFTHAPPAPSPATDRSRFVANHEGVTFYSVSVQFELNTVDCTVPSWIVPLTR